MALKRINKELTDLGRYVLFISVSWATQGLSGVGAGGVTDQRIKPSINMTSSLADSMFLTNSDPPSSCSAGPIGDDLVRSY